VVNLTAQLGNQVLKNCLFSFVSACANTYTFKKYRLIQEKSITTAEGIYGPDQRTNSRQWHEEYGSEEITSPTVSLTSVYLGASIAAKENLHVASKDLGMAYVNADMKREVIMRVKNKPLKYRIDSDGCIYAVLEKA
jgi:hypothetical protein